MPANRILITICFVLTLGAIAADAKDKPKRPFPFLEQEVPSKIQRIMMKAEELTVEINKLDELAAGGNTLAERKAERLLDKRDEYAEEIDEEIKDELESHASKRERLGKKLHRLGDQLERAGDNESRIADIEKDMREIEQQLDFYIALEDAYSMFSAHVRGERPEGTPYGRLGLSAPKFVAPAYDPEKPAFKLQDHFGKAIILVFFATANDDSMDNLRDMQRVLRDYDEDEALLVGINVDDDQEEAKDFVKSRRPDFPVIDDSSWDVRKRYSVKFIPQIVLIDREGAVARVQVGDSSRTRTTFRDDLKKMFEEDD